MKFLQHFEQVYVVVVSLFYLWSVCTAFVVVVPSRSIRHSSSSSSSRSSSTPVTKSHGLQYEYSKQQQQQSRRLSLLSLQASNNNNNNNIDENNNNNDDDDNNKNDDMIFFDDFADLDFLGGSDTNEDLPPPPQTISSSQQEQKQQQQQQQDNNSSFLTDRIQTLQQQEMQQQAVLLQNWKLGNWQVRGFSLEPELENNNKEDDEDEPKQPPKDLTPEEFIAQQQEKARAAAAAAAKKGQQQAAAATAAKLFGQTPTSLEPPKNDDNDKKNKNNDAVSVCRIVADATDFMEQDNCIWVGRTDGSIYYIQLGTDYWTAFRSTTGEEQQDTTTTSSFLQQETVLEYFKDDDEDDENDDDDDDNSSSSIPKLPLKQKTTKPFEIKGSIQAGDGAVTAIAAVTVTDIDGDFSSHLLYTATANGNGMMQQWLVQESDDDDDENNNKNNNNHNKNPPKIIPTVQLTGGAHTTAPFFMKPLSLDTDDVDNDEPTILLSVDESAIALWDIATGDLLYQCQIASASTSDNDDDANDYDGTTGSSSSTSSPKITSADSNGIHIYLGTTSGQVLAYSITDLLSSAAIAGPTATCPLPSGQWQASSTDGGASAVTSVACGGEGTLGRGRNQPTYILFTGNEDGTVKQWEVLQVNNNRLEQWPKLSTQRLPKKAHLFPGSPDQPAVSAIVSLQGMPNMLSAYTDGTIRAWNTGTGKELFRMEGFVSSSSSRSDSSSSSSSNGGGGVNSLCVLERGNLLVTDGMGKFVCVHDFKQAHDDDVDDFELDMPEYRD